VPPGFLRRSTSLRHAKAGRIEGSNKQPSVSVYAEERIAMQEMMYLEQLFGRGNTLWVSVTLLMGFLLVLIFRPNTIHRPILFRVACWLLALTVVVPACVSLLLSLCSPGGYPGRMSQNFELSFFMACANLTGPILQGACVICGLTALLPPLSQRWEPTGPARHPLE
jgi:Na+-translocating ferredoxin:NAD+ oxidoreductase RnfD subunit